MQAIDLQRLIQPWPCANEFPATPMLGGTALAYSEVGERLAAIRADMGETQKSMSSRLGLGESTWQRLELGGNLPSGDTLLRVAELGYSPSWVLTGHGAMRLDGSGGFPVDADLTARVSEAVARIHREAGITLTDAGLGRLVFEMLGAIGKASEGPEEYSHQLEIMATRLRRDLKKAVADPGSGKRSAS